MEKGIIIIIAFVFSIQILISSGYVKIIWFIIGVLIFPTFVYILEKPSISFQRLMIFSLLISILGQNRKWLVLQIKSFPFKSSFVLMFFMLLLIGIADTKINVFYKFYRPLVFFVENFLVLFMTFSFINSKKSAYKVFEYIYFLLFAFTIYGIINWITKQNLYIDILTQTYGTRNVTKDYMNFSLNRFRISSFTDHPIYYGFILTLIILNIANGDNFKPLRNKIFKIILIIMLIINIILVNSRTPMISLIIGGVILYLFNFYYNKKLLIAITSIILIYFAFAFIPNNSIIEQSIDIFNDSRSKVEGSSMDMRMIQLGASIEIFSKSPIYGHGFNFIIEGLGFNSNLDQRTSDTTLFGFESYSYKLLIEQGILGIFAHIVLFWQLLFYFFISKFNRLTYQIRIQCIAQVVAFLIFILGTGDLGTFPIFMAILGINTKIIFLLENINTEKINYGKFIN